MTPHYLPAQLISCTMLYHRQLRKGHQALAGQDRARWKSIPGYLLDAKTPPGPFPFTMTVEMPRRILRSCRQPAEIVGRGGGALPLSEGDKDKRIPDRGRVSQSLTGSLTVPAAEALRLSNYDPGIISVRVWKKYSYRIPCPSPSHCTMTSFVLKGPGHSGDQLTSSPQTIKLTAIGYQLGYRGYRDLSNQVNPVVIQYIVSDCVPGHF